jgi:hypothetical protein
MSKKTFIVLIVLVLIIGAVVVWFNRHQNQVSNEVTTPILSVTTFNQTQNVWAALTTAHPGDLIVYGLTVENQTDKIVSGYMIEVDISHVIDKSTLIDGQGASYNSANNTLVWTPLDIQAKSSIQKQFSVRVNPVAVGSTNPVLKITFNNESNVSISASPTTVAGVATANSSNTYKAPVTGPAGDLSIWLSLAATGIFFGIKKYRASRA